MKPKKGKRPAGSADRKRKKSAKGKGDSEGAGPKVMGYHHWARFGLGLLNGQYRDKQENRTNNRTKKLEDVKLNGPRVTFEQYPQSEIFPGSGYGFLYGEVRDEKPDRSYWQKRQSMLTALGYVFHRNRLIAPVIGLHWEFNRIDISQDDSPEVVKSDLRAYVVGLHYRQKIWGTGSSFAFYHKGRFHLLNPGMQSYGFEVEAGPGFTLSIGGFEAGLELGMLYQQYHGQRDASEDDNRQIRLVSTSQSAYAMLIIWL